MLTTVFLDQIKRTKEIDEGSPELIFLKAVCAGDRDIRECFANSTASGRSVVLDAPNGRYEGRDAIQAYANNWFAMASATSAEVHPVVQTKAGNRSVSEVEIWFYHGDALINRIPMAVHVDLSVDRKITGMRLYYFYKYIEGTSAYRKPIFKPQFNAMASTATMTDIIRYYYEQLHNPVSHEACKRIVDMAADDIFFGGYRPSEYQEPCMCKDEAFVAHYKEITGFIPSQQYIRFETIVDDGTTCVVEWTSIITKAGLEAGAVSQAGMAAYDRNEAGKLSSIRICDNLGYEEAINRAMISPKDMYVDLGEN